MRPKSKDRLGFVLTLLVLGFALCAFSVSAYAASTIDASGGLDKSFTAGYAQKTFAESFHKDSTEPLDLESTYNTWQVHKGFNFSTVYDSNLNSVQNRKAQEEDFILSYTPSIGLSRKGDVGYVKLLYDMNYTQYLDNEDFDRFNHSITTGVGRDFNRLHVDLTNNFKPDTAYRSGERTELRSAEADRVVTYSDAGSLSVNYDLSPKTKIGFQENVSVLYFPEGDNTAAIHDLSQATYTSIPSLTYKLTPKIDVFAKYQYARSDFFEASGDLFASDSVQYGGGVNASLWAKTKLSVDIGYLDRSFDNEDLAAGDSSVVYRAAVSQKLTNKISVTLWTSRDLSQNFDQTVSRDINEEVDFYGANLSIKLMPHLSIDGGASAGYSSRDGLVTLADLENPGTGKKLDTAQLEHQYYETDLSLNWNPRPFLAVALGYEFFNKNSSFRQLEYDDHKVISSVRLKF